MIASLTSWLYDRCPDISPMKGVQNARTSIVDLFKSYVIAPLEHRAIGDLRTFNPENSIVDWTESGDLGIHHFGLLGSMAVWKPKSEMELATFLEEIDKESDARVQYRSAQMLVDSAPVVVADTGPLAMAHRRDAVAFLVPSRFIEIVRKLASSEIDYVDPGIIAMKAVARGLLGIDESSIDHTCFMELMNLAKDFKTYSSLPIPNQVLRLMPDFRKKQKKYKEFSENLLQVEVQRVVGLLATGVDKKELAKSGLLIKEIISKIDGKQNIETLHKDKDLKALILLLLATDNLYNPFTSMVRNMRSTIRNMDRYIENVAKYNLTSASYEKLFHKFKSLYQEAEAVAIDPLKMLNLTETPALESEYQNSLNETHSEDTAIAVRYARKGIKCGDHQIPTNTVIAIHRPLATVHEKSSHFSSGKRICPGRKVAEIIYKTMLTYIIESNIKKYPNLAAVLSPNSAPSTKISELYFLEKPGLMAYYSQGFESPTEDMMLTPVKRSVTITLPKLAIPD